MADGDLDHVRQIAAGGGDRAAVGRAVR